MKKKLGCFFLSCLVFCYVVPVKAVVLDSFSSQLVANYCGDADRRAVLYIHICVDKDEDWLKFVPESENWSNDPVLDTLYTDMEFDCVIPGRKGGTHNGRGNGKHIMAEEMVRLNGESSFSFKAHTMRTER